MKETELYWLWLSVRPGCSVRLLRELVEEFGSPEAVWRAERTELEQYPQLKKQHIAALLEKELSYAGRIQSDCARLGIDILTWEDAGYPQPLRSINDPPLLLYVRGQLPDFEAALSISIVGTRSCTRYGMDAARYFAGKLSQQGCIIVSGMALGIDGEANRAAVEAGGKTVAVLGSGVDVCYPWEHKQLLEDIVRSGAVISEYPPGTEPVGWHFPARNRIITGLSRATLVIEAPRKSGALISADIALEQGRDVFAVPGNINRPNSAGCNALIRQGGAELAQEPSDILSHYRKKEKNGQQPKKQRRKRLHRQEYAPQEEPSIPRSQAVIKRKLEAQPDERRVWLAVHDGNHAVDAIVEAAALPAASVLTALTMLEVGGYIAITPEGYEALPDIEP